MSRLDGLIRELCPDGVERKALGEITTSINIGINPRKFFALNPPDATGFYVTVRELNGLQGVKQYEKTDTISAKAVEIIQGRANIAKGDILFSNTGTVGKMALVLEDPTNWGVNEGIYIIKPRHDVVLSKFLYYFLSGTEAYQDYSKKFTGSTLKHVTQKALAEISIPVPPLEVQQEIVRILDTFANLTAELQAELQARKQQYEYYRDKLLSFPDEVTRKPLEECCKILDNKRKPITKSAREAGEYPYYGANGIQDNVADYIFDGVFILVGEDGSVVTPNGTPAVTWAEGKIWVNNHAHIASEVDGVLLRYLFHCLQTVKVRHLIHGNIPKLTGGDFRELRIPVPAIEEQKRIVDILDRFDTLCNDLSTGLPAEIEARQKQYEYYRDTLLTFKEVGA